MANEKASPKATEKAADAAKVAGAVEQIAEVAEKVIPSGGQLWAIIRGGAAEAKKIAEGHYDEVIHDLWNMAVRHEPGMVGAIESRLADLGIDLPPSDATPLADPNASPKPWRPPGSRRK